jgi:RimJ/RimL family protein N-acetyltransferase
MAKFKAKLIGKRLVLKKLKPTIATASTVFQVIAENRQHLLPWFIWVKTEKSAEDAFKYLLALEEKSKLGEKVDYGIYLNREYIGNVGAFDINQKNKSAEIGYWLSKKFTRNGYMTEAVRLLEKDLFFRLNLHRVQIKCDERNKPSAGVAKKCGYVFEGRHREDIYSDYFKDNRNTLVFSKLKAEFKKQKK